MHSASRATNGFVSTGICRTGPVVATVVFLPLFPVMSAAHADALSGTADSLSLRTDQSVSSKHFAVGGEGLLMALAAFGIGLLLALLAAIVSMATMLSRKLTSNLQAIRLARYALTIKITRIATGQYMAEIAFATQAMQRFFTNRFASLVRIANRSREIPLSSPTPV